MADPLFSEIPASTLNEVKDGIVFDNFFVDTPLQRYFRAEGTLDPFYGGAAMQVPFQFGRLQGGAIAPGQDVTVARKQILDAALFIPKLYSAWTSIEEFQLDVLNAGPEARVDLYELYIETLTKGLNTDVEIDWYRHGQANSGTAILDNRILNMNGLSEAVNNGIDNSWDGNIFTTYGGQLRNGAVGNALNGLVIWMGDANGNPGPISYELMLQTYLFAIERPTLGLTSRQGYSFIAAMLQRQQRYETRVDTNIEMEGIKFEAATIFNDLLTPSAISPSILPTGLSQSTSQTGTFTSTATPTAFSKLPSNKTITVGELLLWIHVPSWKYRPSADPGFMFGVRGPIPSPTNPTMDALFMRLALNSYTPVPRNSVQCYGMAS